MHTGTHAKKAHAHLCMRKVQNYGRCAVALVLDKAGARCAFSHRILLDTRFLDQLKNREPLTNRPRLQSIFDPRFEPRSENLTHPFLAFNLGQKFGGARFGGSIVKSIGKGQVSIRSRSSLDGPMQTPFGL
jgi:hypothetical protein